MTDKPKTEPPPPPLGYWRNRRTGMLVKEKSWAGFTFSKLKEGTWPTPGA